MELKVGDLVYTQLGAVLSFAVVSKVNKTTYTVDFLSGGSDTITKVGMTTYGASGWGRKYIPYEGKVDDAVLTQSKQLAYLNEELDAKRSELYAPPRFFPGRSTGESCPAGKPRSRAGSTGGFSAQ